MKYLKNIDLNFNIVIIIISVNYSYERIKEY